MTIDMEKFISFLIKAKKCTYASAGDDFTLPSPFPYSKMLECEEGDLSYRDIYFGTEQFVGQEVVSMKARPVWSMTYSGRTIPGENLSYVYSFLRQALQHVPLKAPFRGPHEFCGDTGLRYQNSCVGNVDFFSGEETIWREDTMIYQLNYSGGWTV